MTNLDKLPIVCSLTSAELGEREATLLAQFRAAIIKTEELQDGYAFHVPGDGERIRQVAELIVAERECCPFLVFEVSALPNMGPVTVRVSGPAGTKEFLSSLLALPGEPTPGTPNEVLPPHKQG
jgi:hypothetical protein